MFKSEKIEQLYARSPGLTCAAIASRLGVTEVDVCHCLGYPPPLKKAPPKIAIDPRPVRPRLEEGMRPETCPRCDSIRVYRHSLQGGNQTYLCKGCGKYFGIKELSADRRTIQ